MTFVITDACVDVMDRSCVDECPVDCIHPGQRMLYIEPAVCIDCGACEPVCPQEAIFPDIFLPDNKQRFTDANASFFEGGGRTDPPEIAALPAP
jgi:NAD-dependent dihydropyrimidine dehydrogenase PreA subunit